MGTLTRKAKLMKQHNQSGGLLKNRREALGLTVNDVADMVQCSRKTVLRYERDGVQASTRFNRFMAIVMVYKLSPDEILDAATLEA